LRIRACLLAAAIALAMGVVALRLLGTTHPPASGMAVMAALGGVRSLEGAAGFLLVNVLISAVVLTVVMVGLTRIGEWRNAMPAARLKGKRSVWRCRNLSEESVKGQRRT